MDKFKKVSFIGAGNVAWHLATAFEGFGHTIPEVYSRSAQSAQQLCNKLYQAAPKTDLNFKNSSAEIFIIAVPDKAIPLVVDEISIPPSSTLIHTSGTVSLDALKELGNPHGIIYPIQTFTKGRKINFKEVPFSIEGSNSGTLEIIQLLAETLSKKIYKHSTEKRRVIHLAGVFAANFTNHMFTISKGLLESNNLTFDLVKPLIVEVLQKAFDIGPEKAQTGPAVRQDLDTIKKHLSYLSEESGLSEIYQAVTDDIVKTYEV